MFTTYIAKTYLPLLQQIANSPKKIGLVETLVRSGDTFRVGI